jgi:cephalosporin-C deacetylase-like acetyl esterase
MKTLSWSFLAFTFALTASAAAYRNPYGKMPTNATAGDRMFADYFRAETRTLQERCLADIQSLDDWNKAKGKYRAQLHEMLGLDPVPPKTDLKATITGTIDQPDFTVEKLHFQSRPGLYVTANLYVPKNLKARAPTILYVCGHANIKTNGISYGNKVGYQHWGVWFARNGYVALLIDTVQLGEIEGIHHGTYREGMWWWNSRGYSSAAAEAWNCIRALDYLETRPEVDKTRFGVTGRSGGGAYSWWIAALDERIKAACPTAGITDLQNHVVDGCVEGHCDCMFMVNTYRWDYAQVAALVAPRPLLICNSDKDTIFPLDGVGRVHEKVRKIYDLHNAPDKLGLIITEGPHKDTQELQVPVMRWFNKWLKKDESPVPNYAEKLFTPQQLKVFDKPPTDQITKTCYENFTKLASDAEPLDSKKALAELREKTFGGWPSEPGPLNVRFTTERQWLGRRADEYSFDSQTQVPLTIRVAHLTGKKKPASIHLLVSENMLEAFSGGSGEREDEGFALVAPRGTSGTALSPEPRYFGQSRRRFMLLGQTLAGMQVWDVRRAIQAVRSLDSLKDVPIELHASKDMTEIACFAAPFEPGVSAVHLVTPPRSDKEAPDFLNWSRIITPQQLLQLTQEKCKVVIDPPKTN